MKALIVYYSLNGNTEYVVTQLAPLLNADTLRVNPIKEYPSSGFKKFLWGGKSAVMAETPKLQPYTCDVAAYDHIVFCFPVWAGNITPPIRSFIVQNRKELTGKRIAAVACQSGAGAEKAFHKLAEVLGVETIEPTLALIDPKDKKSDTNMDRIKEFSRKFSVNVRIS